MHNTKEGKGSCPQESRVVLYAGTGKLRKFKPGITPPEHPMVTREIPQNTEASLNGQPTSQAENLFASTATRVVFDKGMFKETVRTPERGLFMNGFSSGSTVNTINEDAYVFLEQIGFGAVADGLGAYGSSWKTSFIILETMKQLIIHRGLAVKREQPIKDVDETIQDAVVMAQTFLDNLSYQRDAAPTPGSYEENFVLSAVVDAFNRKYPGEKIRGIDRQSGATLVAARIKNGEEINGVSLGDSRLYEIYMDGSVECITTDDNMSLIEDLLDYDEVKIKQVRAALDNYKSEEHLQELLNQVEDGLGEDFSFINALHEQKSKLSKYIQAQGRGQHIQPNTFSRKIGQNVAGYAFMSDMIYRNLTPADMQRVLLQGAEEGKELEAVLRNLENHALVFAAEAVAKDQGNVRATPDHATVVHIGFGERTRVPVAA